MAQEADQPITLTYHFEISTSDYAKRFGIELPDDSMDAVMTVEDEEESTPTSPKPSVFTFDEAIAGGAGVPWAFLSAPTKKEKESVAEDATVSYGSQRIQPTCKATLAECKAKNPMTCRFHGAKAIAQDVEASLRAAGVNGNVDVVIDNVSIRNGKEILSVTAKIRSTKKEQNAVKQAMAQFFQNPGVTGDVDEVDYESGYNYAGFEVDMLDPNAKAKWAEPYQQQQTQPPPAAPQPPSKPSEPPPQPSTPPPPQTPPETTEKPKDIDPPGFAVPTTRRMRKRAVQTPPPQETPVAPPEQSASMPPMDDDDDDAPVLYPDVAPVKPPPFTPIFTPAEMEELERLGSTGKHGRLYKTCKTLEHKIAKDDIDNYLQKNGGQLPARLQKYKNEIQANRAHFEDLAKRDPHGQVQKYLDLMDKIDASEKNGWHDSVMPGKWDGQDLDFSDYKFDASLYADPYAKERKAYEAWKKTRDPKKKRQGFLSTCGIVDDSDKKDAPKKELASAREADKNMANLEDSMSTIRQAIAEAPGEDSKKMLESFLKKIGQEYYRQNDAYERATVAVQDWIKKQEVVSPNSTIEEALSRMAVIPRTLKNWASWVKQRDKVAEKYVLQRFRGFPGWTKSELPQRVAQLKKNMNLLLPHLHFYHVGTDHCNSSLANSGSIHGNSHNTDYQDGLCNAFGYNGGQYNSKDMQLYAVCALEANPFNVPWIQGMMNGTYGRPIVAEIDPKKTPVGILFKRGYGFWNGEDESDYGSMPLITDPTVSSMVGHEFSRQSAEVDFTGMSPAQMFKIMFPNGHASMMETWAVNGVNTKDKSLKKLFSKKSYYRSDVSKELKKNGIPYVDIKTGKEF